MLVRGKKGGLFLKKPGWGGGFMDYVKMPELLSKDTAKILAENISAIKSAVDDDVSPAYNGSDGMVNTFSPKKIKFVIFLSNVAIFNMDAASDYDSPV